MAWLYLTLYVISSSIFGLCIKWMHVRGTEDVITAGAINYIVAALIIGPWCFLDGQQTGDVPAIVSGTSMGAVYFTAYFFVIWCVRVVGVSSTSVVSVLSMLIPIVFAALVWGDQPSLLQSAGITLALVSLILIGIKPKKQSTAKVTDSDVVAEKNFSWVPTLILGGFFLLCGLSRVAQEAFKHVSPIDQKPTFLLAAFLAAGVPASIVLLWRRRKILPMELFIGFLMGVTNGSQVWLTLRTLDYLEGFIFFPVSSAGTIIFTMFVAVLFLQERISRRAMIGIGVAVVALVMMNLGSADSEGETSVESGLVSEASRP
jgi:drug/metabolite transporter (DMT)-like permease